MKRASLPLLMVLLACLGLALWQFVARRPGTIRAGESVPAGPDRIALESSSEHLRGNETELALESAHAGARMQADARAHPSSSLRGNSYISGWVFRVAGREHASLPGVPVKLWLAAAGEPFSVAATPIGETSTRAMGSFRISELPLGSYFVSVEPEGYARHVARIELEEPGDGKTLEFLLGHSRVEGLVTALDGDARPTLELDYERRSRTECRWPDEQGRFAFEDLPAGPCALRVRWHTGVPGSWREDITRFELGDGSTLSYRVGSALPLSRWSGRVSVAGGQQPRADAALRFDHDAPEQESGEQPEPARFDLDEAGRRCMLSDPHLRVRVGLDARGRFDAALPRTNWLAALEVDALTHRICALGEGSLAGGELQLDLVCPGSRVRGHVLGASRAGSASALRVVGKQPHASTSDSCWAAVGARGEFVLDGLDPGDWEFEPQSLPKGWTCEPVPLEIGKKARVVELDLRVKSP